MNENIFRILAALILFTGVGISAYFRRKADKETGEALSRKADGTLLMNIIRIGGLALWLSPLVYLINPAWMNWSKIGLPEWTRWLGAGVGIFCVMGIYWLFSSIQTGITPVSATRKNHKLATHGIYKYIRHPLYTIGSSFFISIGVMADNWLIIGLGIFAFLLMAIRTPKEEENLIAKFGDEYREYMKQTGKFLPKLKH
ncbi:MAG: isoprenylcysteine carboxylmethyltransferase family protein [Anaerolineales bacterium]|nr:isoprenylcysteine carboxylmethyltransferase family protein [Anaerolineales bacterium]MCB9145569.1 isoprenylcysteine carboxylmethyltransferase family protein [Anaerolineales bacterium]